MFRLFKTSVFWASLLLLFSFTQPYYQSFQHDVIGDAAAGIVKKECFVQDVAFAIYRENAISCQLAVIFLLLLIGVGWGQRKLHVSRVVTGALFFYLLAFIMATFCGGFGSAVVVTHGQFGVGITAWGDPVAISRGFYLFLMAAFFAILSVFGERKSAEP